MSTKTQKRKVVRLENLSTAIEPAKIEFINQQIQEVAVENEVTPPALSFSDECKKSIRAALLSKRVDIDGIAIGIALGDSSAVKLFQKQFSGLHVEKRIDHIEGELEKLRVMLAVPTLRDAVKVSIPKASLFNRDELLKEINELKVAGEAGYRRILQERYEKVALPLPGFKALTGFTAEQILQGFGY